MASHVALVVQDKYDRLRKEFLSIAEYHIDNDTLTELKNNYAHEIDSKRKLSGIKNLAALINILEIRNVLSHDNLEPLHYISKRFVQKPSLRTKLLDYESWFESVSYPENINMYFDKNVKPVSSRQENKTNDRMVTTSSLSNQADQLPSNYESTSVTKAVSETERLWEQAGNSTVLFLSKEEEFYHTVLQQLSEKLGRSWRDVARFMNIRECEIDAIQSKHPYNLKEQSYEALKICTSGQNKTDKWKFNLMRALERARRKDLREFMEELMCSYNLRNLEKRSI